MYMYKIAKNVYSVKHIMANQPLLHMKVVSLVEVLFARIDTAMNYKLCQIDPLPYRQYFVV